MLSMKKALCLSALLFSSPLVFGDVIGAKAGAEYWQTKDHGKAASVFVQAEHPIPLAPNLALRATAIEGKEDSFKTIDAYGYYEVLDNSLVSVDLGGGLHRIDGNRYYDNNLPMAVADLELLPDNDLSFYTKVMYGKKSGDSAKDLSAGARLEMLPAIYLQLGYRKYTLEMDGTNSMSDNIQGFTAGVHVDI